MRVNAQVLLMRCKSSRKLFGVRIQQEKSKDWIMTMSFDMDETRAKREGFDKTVITADCYPEDGYPGCPTCGANGFVRCSSCSKLTCWCGENDSVCAWCGASMSNIAYRGPMDLSVGTD